MECAGCPLQVLLKCGQENVSAAARAHTYLRYLPTAQARQELPH